MVDKKNKRGLGRGLDSLIPKIDDGEDEKNKKSSITLEDILSNTEDEGETVPKDDEGNIIEKKDEEIEKLEKSSENIEKENNEKGKEKKEINETNKIDEKSNLESADLENKKIEKEERIEDETSEKKDIIKEEKNEKAEENLEKSVEIENIEDIDKSNQSKEIESVEIETEKEKETELSEYEKSSIAEVKEIIEKNPRITLWSAKSSAVFRYLRKTRPEFSISKEASELIDESVSKKYPEIWELFKDL